MTKSSQSSRTLWHQLLGKVLEELLPPVGITVYVDFPVMSQPPQADIVLLRREQPQWTPEQQARLPDGIRHSQATDIIIEFKYTESINEQAFQQALSYDFFYKTAQQLKTQKVQTFLLSAKQPQAERLAKWGYVSTEYKGVYRSQYPLLSQVTLLSLNQLSDEPHNAWVKCFASRLDEKQKAFEQLSHSIKTLSWPLEQIITSLWQFWFILKGGKMKIELTPEQVEQTGKMWGERYLRSLPIEEIMRYVKPEELMRYVKPEDILAQLKPTERLAGLKPMERLVGLKPSERLAGLKQQELDELEQQIKKLKQKKT
jgi:hypothetical protein